jgi:hypothetical protein
VGEFFRRVGVIAKPQLRFLLFDLARHLTKHHRSELHIYCSTLQERNFYQTEGADVFAGVHIFPSASQQSLAERAVEAEELAQAEANEKKYGATYNLLSMANRHLGRGYALAGPGHPRSRMSEKSNYAHILRTYNRSLGFWEKELQERDLSLLLNGGLEAWLVARKRRVPYRVFTGSRFKSLYNWAWTPQLDNPEFEFAYKQDEEPTGIGVPLELNIPYNSHLANRERFIAQTTTRRLLKRAATEIAKYSWWTFQDYDKAKGYYLSENLRLFYRIWQDWRELSRVASAELTDFSDKYRVYFPLHIEPEAALQMVSPEYFSQLSTIAMITRDLPAGVRLMVKETFGAIGRRPVDFYRQLADLKPLIFLKPLELGLECARASQAVVTICGTGGFEGAILGKPVISFGHHNNYNFLPHVRHVTDTSDLSSTLRWAFSDSFDQEAAKESGTRFLRSVAARSFDLEDFDYAHTNELRPVLIKRLSGALERSLSHEALHGSEGIRNGIFAAPRPLDA